MSEKKDKSNLEDKVKKSSESAPVNSEELKREFSRRDILKSLASVPVLGAFTYAFLKKQKFDKRKHDNILEEIKVQGEINWEDNRNIDGEPLRVGIIGAGGRGSHLLKALGFLHPDKVQELKEAAEENPRDTRYKEFIEQEDLNVRLTAVCDIFTVRAKRAQEAGANIKRRGNDFTPDALPKIYKHHEDLLNADDVDAVIIATPDHWHSPIAVKAAKKGKHIYCEKPLSWTVPETYDVRKEVKDAGVVFQLGHQHRQTESHFRAKNAIDQGALGKVTLIEVTTNRNSPNGAWVYDIDPEASPETIDWDQFIGPAPYHKFSLERFFRWRCWWDYSTGLSGDLLTHEYDAMNQIFEFGIPDTAVSSGGIYYYKDGRTVPDVLQTVFEYKERDLTLMYSATLANGRNRGKVIMGSDGSMELGKNMIVYADPDSKRYKERIEKGIIDPSLPILSYTPGKNQVDAITSATEKYFAGRGLLYTYRNGKRVDTTNLHVREWVSCIKNGGIPSCNIDRAFEEAITAHMGTIAYKEGRRVNWDREKETII